MQDGSAGIDGITSGSGGSKGGQSQTSKALSGSDTSDVKGDNIDNGKTPLGGLKLRETWALVNLLAAILCLIASIVLLAGMLKKKNDQQQKKTWRILAIITGILSPIAFFITEDMTKKMQFVDSWTWLMLILLVVQVVCILIMRSTQNKQDNNQPET